MFPFNFRTGLGESAALKPTGSPRAWAVTWKFKAWVEGKGEKQLNHKRGCFPLDLSSAGHCLSYTQKSLRRVLALEQRCFRLNTGK